MTLLAFSFVLLSVGADGFEAHPARGAEKKGAQSQAVLRTYQPYGWCHRRDTVRIPGCGTGESSPAG